MTSGLESCPCPASAPWPIPERVGERWWRWKVRNVLPDPLQQAREERLSVERSNGDGRGHGPSHKAEHGHDRVLSEPVALKGHGGALGDKGAPGLAWIEELKKKGRERENDNPIRSNPI